MAQLQAVFTGDLIGSRAAPERAVEQAMTALKNAAQGIGKAEDIDLRFTRHRGDGWQILLPDPRHCLTAYLALTAGLRAADSGLSTRMAIGLGPVTSPGTSDLSDAAGAGFVTSGDLLAELGRAAGPGHVQIGGPGVTDWQKGIFGLAGWIASGWSAQQAEAVHIVLMERDETSNAHRAAQLGISRQAFEARLKGAGLAAFEPARRAFLAHDFKAAP